MGRSGVPAWFLGLSLVTLPAVAAPSETNPPTAAPAATPARTSTAAARSDIVRLKNGGIVRGTIDENLPDEYVVIVTPSGESRRFDWLEIDYAGPAEVSPAADRQQETDGKSVTSAPAAASPAATVSSAEAGTVSRSMHPVRIAGLIVGTLGVGLTVAAVLMQIQHSGAQRDLEQLCGVDHDCTNSSPRPMTQDQLSQARSLNDDFARYDGLPLPLGALGVTGIVAGTIMFFIAPATQRGSAAPWQFVAAAPRSNWGGVSVIGAF